MRVVGQSAMEFRPGTRGGNSRSIIAKPLPEIRFSTAALCAHVVADRLRVVSVVLVVKQLLALYSGTVNQVQCRWQSNTCGANQTPKCCVGPGATAKWYGIRGRRNEMIKRRRSRSKGKTPGANRNPCAVKHRPGTLLPLVLKRKLVTPCRTTELISHVPTRHRYRHVLQRDRCVVCQSYGVFGY